MRYNRRCMCGIAGILSWDPKRPVVEQQLRAMSGALAHRGPDGEAVWMSPAVPVRVGLAFRRLAVLDPDPRAMQPMRSADGRFTLVFNGEIYNFPELKKRLPDKQWKTTGDAEVLLAALGEWGPDVCLPRLDGMFALALWDSRERALLLARDRMGQKPLYVATGQGTVAFSSELSALHQWPGWDTTTDADALQHYLRYGYVPPGRTIYAGASQIDPGSYAVVHGGNGGKVAVQRWYVPAPAEPRTRTKRQPEVTRDLIEKAVWRQLVSDVPRGVFLSGGIDSSVIAWCARRAGPLKTFSIGFDDARYDETPYAEEVARALGTEHQTFRVSPAVADDLPLIAAAFGEPFADSSALPTYWLSQKTREHVTVALSGDGGDELFGGYDRYRAIGMPVRPLKPLAAIGRRLERGHPKSRRTRAGRLLASAGLSTGRRYDRYVSLFAAEDAATLLGRPETYTQAEWFDDFRQAAGGDVEAALVLDRMTYLPGDLLTKVDRCSMLHALEVRSPFLDAAVLHFATTLTRRDLLAGGPKRLLREAFASELPPAVFKRKKTGFAVPIGEWLRHALKSMLRDHVLASDSFCQSNLDMTPVKRMLDEHDSGQREHGQRLYALLMLELWWRLRSS